MTIRYVTKDHDPSCETLHLVKNSLYGNIFKPPIRFTQESTEIAWSSYSDFFYSHPSSRIFNLTWHDANHLCRDVGGRLRTYLKKQDALEVFEAIAHRFGRPNTDILVFKHFPGSTVRHLLFLS